MAKKITFCIFILFVLGITRAKAQETVCVSGGDAYGNGSISFTVGQPFYVVESNNNGCVSPGVQQTYIISSVETAVLEMIPLIKMSVYPNPAADFLTLRVYNESPKKLRYTLSDNNGRNLKQSIAENTFTEIDMSRFEPSIYFINVFDGDRRLQTFKIVKVK